VGPTQGWNARNSAGKTNVALYGVAVVCIVVGFYLQGYTKINLLTDQTSSPYQAAGIALIIVGFLLAIFARSQAKKQLRK
jgi:drug/metabolite transporter (DMT)-like permease